MQFGIGTFATIAAGLFSLAAPAAADDASTPAIGSASGFSVASACSIMAGDDSASNPASTTAQARRMFLAALASEHTNASTLTRLLPRAGRPLAALIGAAPAGGARAEAVLRRLGLDPARFMASRSAGAPVSAWGSGQATLVSYAQSLAAGSPQPQGSNSAQGGPFIAAADPRVRTLQADAARAAAMAVTFAGIPSFLPVNRPKRSSDFGYRSDPLHGGGAFHAGIDLTGRTGDMIHAAADGVVIRAGWWAGYGKVVVIDHGNGIETRYGHMSRFHVQAGDEVRQGQAIGGMGSTGRSTGTHLHFEVRLDGNAIDPQPFLDFASFGVDAPARVSQAAAAPLDLITDEPFAPLASDDRVMAAGRMWTVRAGR